MIKHRAPWIAIGISLALVIPILGFLSTSEQTPITGYAVYSGVVEGAEFFVTVDNHPYTYRFMEGRWFEENDEGWEYRPDMGKTMWTGLLYLQSYNARIYYGAYEITDVYEFARAWK